MILEEMHIVDSTGTVLLEWTKDMWKTLIVNNSCVVQVSDWKMLMMVKDYTTENSNMKLKDILDNK